MKSTQKIVSNETEKLLPVTPRPTPMPRKRTLFSNNDTSNVILEKDSLREIFEKSERSMKNPNFQLLEIKSFGKQSDVIRLAISDSQDTSVNVLANPDLKQKLENLENKPILKVKKYHIKINVS